MQIAAKKISNKYKKMRGIKSPLLLFLWMKQMQKQLIITMTLARTCLLRKVLLLLQIKYLIGIKKKQAENNLDEAKTINYADDTNLANVRENKNAKILL